MDGPGTRASRPDDGSALMSVVILLMVIAATALLLNLEGAIGADAAGREREATEARYVAEAGYGHARWLLQQNGLCSGYADLGATPFGGHHFEATVNPTSGSPVRVRATGTLASGARSVVEGDLAVYQMPVAMELQPGAAGDDTYLWDGAHKDKNFGATTILSLDNQGAERTALLRFDLSTLPPGRVQSAHLELYLEGGNAINDGTIDLHRVTQEWDEGVNDDGEPSFIPGATYEEYSARLIGTRPWVTPGGDFDATPSASLFLASLVPGFYQWDVTDLVISWRDGVTNHGMLLRGSTGNVEKIDFTSGDGAPASQRPKLVLEYACECGFDCGAPASATDVLVGSTAAPATLGGLSFGELDLVEYVLSADTATLFWDGDATTLSSSVDALHVLEDGQLLLSTGSDTSLGGIDVEPGDVVKYDPIADAAVQILDGATLFGADENLQGLSLSAAGTLLLSTEGDAQIGALEFTDLDVVEYDIATGEATLWLDAETTTLDRSLDALHVLEDGSIVVSADNDASLGGIDFTEGDLVLYNPGTDTGTLFFDQSNFSEANSDWIGLFVGVAGTGSLELPGPIAHWKLDDGTGSTVTDSVGEHHGTRHGANWVGGIDGDALDFDGADDYVAVGSPASLDDLFVGSATLSAWIFPHSFGEHGSGRIAEKSSGAFAGANGWTLFVDSDRENLYFAHGFVDHPGGWATPPGSIALDQWRHVAVVYDAGNLESPPIVYLDGAPAPLVEWSSPEGSPRSDAGEDLRLGNASTSTDMSFDGLLDDVRIYDRLLAPGEVAALVGDCHALDDFESDDYGGSLGSVDWAGPWAEVNESDGPDGGDVRVVSHGGSLALRVKDNDGGGEGVEREINLSGFASGTLNVQTWRDSLDDSDDYVTVEISGNGGSSWTELDRIAGPGTDSAWVPKNYDLSPYLAADTRVRFISSPTLGGADRVYFDDVRIELSGGTCD